MDQEALMRQIVEQVMSAMNKGVSAPAAPAGAACAAPCRHGLAGHA